MTEKGEKRGASRFLSSLPAVLHLEGGDHPCLAHDLSRRGALLVGSLPPDAGPEVEVTVQSPAGDLRLRCRARIIRATVGDEEAATELALHFDLREPSERERLESLVARVVEGATPAALQALSQTATRLQIREALESTPLPHRIALAVRGQPREREILLQDPSPQVIDALVRNPQLLPNEVRAILRMPVLLPGSLDVLARDARWQGSEELRVLIAGHRNTPFAVAEKLASKMKPDSLQKLLRRPGLNPALRAKLVRNRPG